MWNWGIWFNLVKNRIWEEMLLLFKTLITLANIHSQLQNPASYFFLTYAGSGKPLENFTVDSRVIIVSSQSQNPTYQIFNYLQTLALQHICLNMFDWLVEYLFEKSHLYTSRKKARKCLWINMWSFKLFSVHCIVFLFIFIF